MPFTDELICRKLDRLTELLESLLDLLTTGIRPAGMRSTAFGSRKEDLLLTTEQAAEYLGMTSRFLEEKRRTGGGPLFVRISARAVRYRESALRAWLEMRTVANTSQMTPDGL